MGSSNASANTIAIQNALASCDATHNVVNLPAGTYYVAGWTYAPQGHQVVRGAGPNGTYIYTTSQAGCAGSFSNVCMISSTPTYAQSSVVLPGGSNQCSWTAGYAQGTTSITLNSCGGPPPLNQTIILDQQNDTADNGGDYICDDTISGCTLKAQGSGNPSGRVGGSFTITHGQQQVVYVTSVSGSGSGPYTVTISPGVYFNNIRAGQSPGAWWPGFVQNDGIENLTLDYSLNTGSAYGLTMYNCYQCWVKNIRSMWGRRDHVYVSQSAKDVVRDSYFYQGQTHESSSYVIEPAESSDVLVENNIFQQITNPVTFNQGSGWVFGYNFSVDNVVGGSYMQGSYVGHNSGAGMNLFEGNNFNSLLCDATWGSTTLTTYYRNMVPGWESGYTYQTIPIDADSYCRAFNIIGNVLGQPGFHTIYESYAPSTNGGSTAFSSSIYGLSWTNNGGLGNCTSPPSCDTLVRSTLMRWGNYDVVNGAVQWNSTESSPGAVAFINAQSTPANHILPASFYLSGRPTWWRSMPFPAIGPDVSAGALGICTGTYSGAMSTGSGLCVGGTLSSAWAGHANAIPAQDCFLNVMQGPPDGTGGVLNFDASACYNAIGPQPPTNLSAAVQ